MAEDKPEISKKAIKTYVPESQVMEAESGENQS